MGSHSGSWEKNGTAKASDAGDHGKPRRIQGKSGTTKAIDAESHGKPLRIEGNSGTTKANGAGS